MSSSPPDESASSSYGVLLTPATHASESRTSDLNTAVVYASRASATGEMNDAQLTDKDNQYLQDHAAEMTFDAGERISALHQSDLEKVVDEVPDDDFQWRSVICGTLIGCVMSAQNVYFGLRNGNSFGDGIVASLIGHGIMTAITKRFNLRQFGMHEQVVLQTAATSNISTIFIGGFSTYLLAMSPTIRDIMNMEAPDANTWTPTYGYCVLWLLTASFMGFFLSQPFRKKLVIEQDLPWPTPTATAMVCKALHAEGSEATVLQKWIRNSGIASFSWQIYKFLFNRSGMMDKWPILGPIAAKYTWYADFSPAYIGGGMLMSYKAAFSMILGALYGFGFILPYVSSKRGVEGWFAADASGMKAEKSYWFLTSLAVTVSESIYQSCKIGVIAIKRARANAKAAASTPNTRAKMVSPVETETRLIPTKFWMTGFLLNALAVSIIIPAVFGVKWYYVVPIIIYAIPLGYGICMGGAITDTFLISAIGKLTVMLFGVLTGDVVSVLWLGGISMITVGSCELLLQDFHIATLTGTSPRAMFTAQFFAAFVGCLVTPASYLLFIRAFDITANGKFTAPGAVALRSLAVLFVDGTDQLPGQVMWFIIPTVVAGLINSLANDLLPERYSKYLPNTMAFAFGFFVKASYPINVITGAILKYAWHALDRPVAEKFYTVLAGGFIAGEGISSIFLAILSIFEVEAPFGMAISFAVYGANSS